MRNKILVILGPTASGKSDLAIKIARQFNGEIISADSRQIYRDMDIGTGKVEPDRPGEIPKEFLSKKFYSGSPLNIPLISNDIPHYMLDIISPKTNYNVSKYKKRAEKIVEDILRRNKLPIICGGTGFWIKALVDDVVFPEVKPDWKLREKLAKYQVEKLFSLLQKLDPARAKNIDAKNKVRLIRAIEICKSIGKVPLATKKDTGKEKYSFLQIGLDIPKKKLHANIAKRLEKRLAQGMLQEVENLHSKNKISWKRLESFGLEYRYISLSLQKKISATEMKEKLLQEIKNYAKKQMAWFQKDKRILWKKNYTEIEKLIKNFLKQ
jgi:tRNA dimethylallyltransferase